MTFDVNCNVLTLRDINFSSITIQNQLKKINFKQNKNIFKEKIINFILNGFQFVVQAGPLLEDHIEGIVFIFSIVKYNLQENEINSYALSGQIISFLKYCFRQSILVRSIRLIQPMYRFKIQVSSLVLGKFYSFLQKHKGIILKEYLIEGISLFNIEAQIPVIQSLGFVNGLRNVTCGFVTTQLLFSGWKLLDQDPFWDELEKFNENPQTGDYAKKMVNEVRTKKGLFPLKEKNINI